MITVQHVYFLSLYFFFFTQNRFPKMMCSQPTNEEYKAINYCLRVGYRVKSGIFRQTAKFGQRPCLFHISNIGIKK